MKCDSLSLSLCSVSAALDFDAVLLKPSEMTSGRKLALVVMPHGTFDCVCGVERLYQQCVDCVVCSGGPHSVLVSEWILSTAVLCKMGFGVLLGEDQSNIFISTLVVCEETLD